MFGLLSGLCFGYSLNAYRQAGLAMDAHHALFAAAASSSPPPRPCSPWASGCCSLALWDRAALKVGVRQPRRPSLAAGASAAPAWASILLKLLQALGLEPAAPVRALGVVEAPVAALAGRRIFREKLSLIQWIAGAAVAAGVAMTALG